MTTPKTKSDAEAWLTDCDRCISDTVDLLTDPRVQSELAALRVPHALHVHTRADAASTNRWIIIRMNLPVGHGLSLDSAMSNAIRHGSLYDLFLDALMDAQAIIKRRREAYEDFLKGQGEGS